MDKIEAAFGIIQQTSSIPELPEGEKKESLGKKISPIVAILSAMLESS